MHKVLIANRGEIAVRIIRACHDLGLQTVAVYSDVDRQAMHVAHADEAVCIGSGPAATSYLKIPNILAACEITNADAIHPGYGFLSENARFASICESSGVTFIGPSSTSIALLGDKAQAKEIAKKVGCPVTPGSDGVVSSVDDALYIAKKIGFPIFIKAVAGGGGKGIRVCYNEKDLSQLFTAACREAEINFGNHHVYIEKMIIDPRHIEIQVIGDTFGSYVHLGERDCSIQRRRQKLIEETPSAVLTDKLREKICGYAVAILRRAKYHSAGTVEFLLDQESNFYFMEVNTRIQVEHTITEELTGIDLVREQIRVAQGATLSFSQEDVAFSGHVVQFRINAEDPQNNFCPSPGLLEHYVPPGGPHIRIDSACYSGYTIPSAYDSMIAKLIVKGKDRAECFVRAKRALKEFHISGVKTTIPFHLDILNHDPFLKSTHNITYVDTCIEKGHVFGTNKE